MRAPRPAGLTLIELIVVLAIAAVAAALVLPMVGRGTQTVRLRTEAGRVAALLREARQHAVTQRRATRVTLDRARHAIAVTASGADRPVRELTLAPGIRLDVAQGGETLTFSPRGTARETRWQLEGPGGRRLLITVEPVTGRVVVAREAAS